MPFFSIIIPIYNVEDYIGRCVHSIKEQSFADFEVILINDGSTDNSLEEMKKSIGSDQRFKIFTTDNKGVGHARNYGIDRSRGNYLFFIDPDDEIYEDSLHLAFNKLKNKNYNILCFGHQIVENNTGKYENSYSFTQEKSLDTKADFINNFHYVLYESTYNAIWNKIYNRDWLINTNIRFTDMKSAQDGFFNSSLLLYIESAYLTKDIYYKYYINREKSATSTFDKDKFFRELEVLKNLQNNIIKLNITDSNNYFKVYISRLVTAEFTQIFSTNRLNYFEKKIWMRSRIKDINTFIKVNKSFRVFCITHFYFFCYSAYKFKKSNRIN